MPLHIIRNNLVNMDCDAIVNTANPLPRIGAGTDSAVYAAAAFDNWDEIPVVERVEKTPA